MGIISETVEVIPSGKAIKYYKDLGYEAKHHIPLIVKVEDLLRNSSVKIDVVCDYCGEKCNVRYVDYCNSIDMDGTYACKHCAYRKASKTIYDRYGVLNYSSTRECREKVSNTLMLRYGVDHVSKSEEFLERKRNNNKEKYGVEHTLQVKEFRDKGIHTNILKYGVKNPLQNEDIKNKMQNTIEQRYGVRYASQNQAMKDKTAQTNLEKYGCECVLLVPEIKNRISNTIKERYGVDNISQSEEIKQKKINTMISHYGVEYPSLSKEITEKRRESFYRNGTTPTSKQQLYLHALYGGEINFPISYYAADLCFPTEHIVCEYDGGGHDLRVTLGQLTQEEFDQKELIRDKVIKSNGYKIIHLISKTDKLPQDQILLDMLTYSRNYFSDYPHHSWIEFNIDDSLVRNAENKQGITYDYCELRTISKADYDNQNNQTNNNLISKGA